MVELKCHQLVELECHQLVELECHQLVELELECPQLFMTAAPTAAAALTAAPQHTFELFQNSATSIPR